ncbi:MAG: SDR family NAD(P)-dependent oxidoreductase [Planctomycetaceae bacterium]
MAIDEMFDLTGRVALITGAAGSLGSAIATVYTDAGADLLLVDIDTDGLHRLAKELERSGQRVRTFVGSVGDIPQMKEAFALLDREFGRIDILVNVAGPAKLGKPEDIDLADVEYSVHHPRDSQILHLPASRQASARSRQREHHQHMLRHGHHGEWPQSYAVQHVDGRRRADDPRAEHGVERSRRAGEFGINVRPDHQ